MVKEVKDKWFNQTLTEVNGSVVRVGIIEGEYHWHKHENDDEFFFVLEGKLLVDLERPNNRIKSGSGCNRYKKCNAQNKSASKNRYTYGRE